MIISKNVDVEVSMIRELFIFLVIFFHKMLRYSSEKERLRLSELDLAYWFG